MRSTSAPSAEVRWDKQHVDVLAARFVLQPERFDVVVASNLFGDILSDLGPACAGTIGLAPSANLDPERRFPSLFEPVQGSAPDIFGQGIANPIEMVWSGALMLAVLGRAPAASAEDTARHVQAHDTIVAAIERVLVEGPWPPARPDSVRGFACKMRIIRNKMAFPVGAQRCRSSQPRPRGPASPSLEPAASSGGKSAMNRNDKFHWALHGPGQAGADDSPWRTPPEAEALLVATLALMTGIVERAALTQPLADHGQSLLMATKVRAHLHGLSAQPQMSEGFRATLARLREHWDRLAGTTPPGAADTQPLADASRLLWFAAPQRLQ